MVDQNFLRNLNLVKYYLKCPLITFYSFLIHSNMDTKILKQTTLYLHYHKHYEISVTLPQMLWLIIIAIIGVQVKFAAVNI